MSALAWLFGIGALTIAFPILFHLIRRTPKGQTEFSSLMFLKPSPPTLTRRSRLENILLLLMRAAAIALIAFAFMRPFFRGSDTLSEFEVANRRVAILLDTSASMRRGECWDEAISQVKEELDLLESDDDAALFTFDQVLRSVVPFGDGRAEMDSRKSEIQEALPDLQPGWARSDLGSALLNIADNLDLWRESQNSNEFSSLARLQIIVVSDLQKSSLIQSLQSYQWPAQVFVKFRGVDAKQPTNATVELMDLVAEEEDPSLRIRVANSPDSKNSQFVVDWLDRQNQKGQNSLPFYVPPGTSRVLKLDPSDAINAEQFVVSGDDSDFDNVFFTVPPKQQTVHVAYIGNEDPDNPEECLFYLTRSLVDSPNRTFAIEQVKTDGSLKIDQTSLLIVNSAVSENQAKAIDQFLDNGGTVLIVLSDSKTTDSTSQWTGVRFIENVKQRAKDYSMLAEIDFSNVVFQPFSNPRYNDFTQIRFWNYQSVDIVDGEVQVIAAFDNHQPAVWQRKVFGGGTVYCFASGWQPSQSQLALSTKFVPLINGLVELAADIPRLEKSLTVGEPIRFASLETETTKRELIKPDGNREVIAPEQTKFTATDLPGIYRLETIATGAAGADSFAFAVNVDRAESETTPIPVEQLEMLGVKIGEQQTASSEMAELRQMRDRDIEDQQKFWKWLIVGAIVLLIGETWLASRAEQQLIAGQAS